MLNASGNDQPIEPHRKRVVIAANPFSGVGANRIRVDRLASSLRAAGLECHIAWTLDERASLLGASDFTDACRCVVVAGGDGTVVGVINQTTAMPIATLPAGNENLFAGALGFKTEPELIAAAIVRGNVRSIDLGVMHRLNAEGQPSGAADASSFFTLMVGVGLDAEVVHRLSAWRKARGGGLKRVRRISYIKPILGTLTGYRWPRLELVADGKVIQTTHAMIFNIPNYAMGLQLCPEASYEDGLLDWIALDRPGMFNALGYYASILTGRVRSRGDVRTGRSREVILRAAGEPVPLQVDGDPAGFTAVRLRAEPKKLRVIDMTG